MNGSGDSPFLLAGQFFGSVLVALAFMAIAWTQAPRVGGEWFIYIRVLATLVAGSVGINVGSIAGVVVGGVIEVFVA